MDDVFERTKARFDAFLEEEAPEAAKMLAMAYERADSADAEEWSQALTSCRRAMKALADVVYPPKSESVDGHAVDDAAYRNRLIQFVKENITSGSQGDFLKTDIESVINRVEALDSLASKGVHSDVDERDLELTVVHTYLLAGEILSLYQPPSEPAAKEVSQDASAQGIPQDPSDTGPPTSLPPISDV